MQHIVPEFRLKKLVSKLNSLNKKGANISYTISNESFLEDYEEYGKIKCFNVEISDNEKAKDYKFIATLEHTTKGNIIRKVEDVELPSRFLTCKPECEHCHTTRKRNDTYIVKELKTGRFMQVGKNCLQELTDENYSHKCAYIATALNIIEDASLMGDGSLFFDMCKLNKSDVYQESTQIKLFMYTYIKLFGYDKYNLSCSLNKFLEGDSSDKIKEVLDNLYKKEVLIEIDNYAKSIDLTQEGYLRNASLAWQSKYISSRDFVLIASFIYTYLKSKDKFDRDSKSNYVGKVGERITIEIKNYTILYTSSNTMYSYYAKPSYTYKITDKDGNIYLWSTQSRISDETTTIVATVKKHSEYKGIKQTTITRGVINESNN